VHRDSMEDCRCNVVVLSADGICHVVQVVVHTELTSAEKVGEAQGRPSVILCGLVWVCPYPARVAE
jgi:hypothetical protein